jgi:rhamnosyltransferase
MIDSSQMRVCILLATYNGQQFIKQQVDSILAQHGVRTVIYVSDDGSRDETVRVIEKMARKSTDIVLLPPVAISGSAARNFIRLCSDVPVAGFDYVAFADQDDIWFPDKLLDGVNEINRLGCDVYSSDVLAFWPNGRQRKIVKSQPQRQLDHFFEAAGPGCTYLARASCFAEFQAFLNMSGGDVCQIQRHDWLFYAWARCAGHAWTISKKQGLLYRQHSNNVAGANIGAKSMFARIRSLNDGWYAGQVQLIARLLAARYPAAVPAFVARLKLLPLLFRTHSLRRRRIQAWLVMLWLILRPRR